MADRHDLTRSDPEAEGIESGAVAALIRALDDPGLGVHSVMIVRHDHVVAECWWAPYEPSRPHTMFSVTKSLTATAIGIAEAEGILSIDEPILTFFPSYATPDAVANARGLRLHHLLSMATGHAIDTMPVMRALPHEDWVRIFFGVPIRFLPGTHFVYNSGASFILSAVIASRTGLSLLDYLTPRVFEPLGIPRPTWQTSPRGICIGGSGVRLTTEDMAKFGLLYLHRGEWQGRRLVTESWVDRATTTQISNETDADDDWGQGYGFQFWRSRHDSYRADGAFGQFILVVPEEDLVVAVTAGTRRHREIPALVWNHLLPALHAGPREPSADGHHELRQSLAGRTIGFPKFLSPDPVAAGFIDRRQIALPSNTLGVSTVRVAFDQSTVALDLAGADGRIESIVAGRDRWIAGRSTHWPYEEMSEVALASRAGWTDETTLEIHQQCIDTPFRRIWSFRVAAGDAVDAVRVEVSVGLDLGLWDPLGQRLIGTLEDSADD